ncbi:hypothetical protein KPL47_15015 [Clostridium estertheticum]|uniref:hypothetical protein n=1 Tax=Clostridium estertheticum TaxID=238834 RepID=UPI001C0D98F0|nr:hypothetical protein [Clostridium estertheticum]MBU3177643.1 hypothetical protein [Clostridium estertheticum]
MKDFLDEINDQELKVIVHSEFYYVFVTNIENIEKLFNIEINDESTKQVMYKMLYANIITAMETYLGDAFINTTFKSDEFITNFANNYEDTKNRKLSVGEALKGEKYLFNIITDDMQNILYHNLPKVKNIYKFTLGVDFPKDTGKLMENMSIRHDIIHRNGKNKHNDEIQLAKVDIIELKDKIGDFITSVDSTLNFIVRNKSEEDVMKPIYKEVSRRDQFGK